MKSKKIVLVLVFLMLFNFSMVHAKGNTNKINKGGNKKRVLIHTPVINKKGVRISSPYGYRIHPVTGNRSFHNGIDIAAPFNTPVHAVLDGEVVMASPNGTAGNEIKIKHANGGETRYLHMNTRSVNVGDKVRAGQIIGTIGATGRVTGAHLHFEFKINGVNKNPAILFKRK